MADTQNPSDLSPLSMGLGGTITAGLVVVILFFVFFVGWAALAPLGSASIAPGVVSVEGNRKTIQHLEGGIVRSINVRNGDRVKKGQVLVELDGTQAQASMDMVWGRKIVTLAQMARLVAERDGMESITFDPWLEERRHQPMAAQSITGQINIFNARRKSRENQKAIMVRKTAQNREEIRGLKEQIKSADRQLELITAEMEIVGALVKKGLAQLPRLRSLQRTEAEIGGNRGQNIARIAQSRLAIGETQLQISELETNFLSEVVQELREFQSQLFELTEQERAARYVYERIKIRAPKDGIIVGLQVHTAGGVIAPGAAVLDIIPTNEALIVEAKVNTSDIDMVHTGLAAQIRFSAFNSRSTLPVDGTIVSISADKLTNERTGADYYLARVKIGDITKANLKLSQLRPGMAADVMIMTGERTALDYFTAPILKSFGRAMRED